MTYKKALRIAKKLARAMLISFYVVEFDYQEGRTCTALSETDSWLDSADFHAFNAKTLAEVSPSGSVKII